MAQVLHAAGTKPRTRIGRLDVALVVACLGIVAAVAVPRQQDMTAAAHRTEVNALAGSIRAAARLGHSLWLSQGEPSSLETARGRVRVVNGYPAAADLALLLERPEGMAFHHAGGIWQHRGRPGGEPCGVSYAPPAAGTPGPAVQLRVSGC